MYAIDKSLYGTLIGNIVEVSRMPVDIDCQFPFY